MQIFFISKQHPQHRALDVYKSHFSDSVAGVRPPHAGAAASVKAAFESVPLLLLLGHKHRCVLLAVALLAGTQVWGRKQHPKARPGLWQEMIGRDEVRRMLKSLSRRVLRE